MPFTSHLDVNSCVLLAIAICISFFPMEHASCSPPSGLVHFDCPVLSSISSSHPLNRIQISGMKHTGMFQNNHSL